MHQRIKEEKYLVIIHPQTTNKDIQTPSIERDGSTGDTSQITTNKNTQAKPAIELRYNG